MAQGSRTASRTDGHIFPPKISYFIRNQFRNQFRDQFRFPTSQNLQTTSRTHGIQGPGDRAAAVAPLDAPREAAHGPPPPPLAPSARAWPPQAQRQQHQRRRPSRRCCCAEAGGRRVLAGQRGRLGRRAVARPASVAAGACHCHRHHRQHRCSAADAPPSTHSYMAQLHPQLMQAKQRTYT